MIVPASYSMATHMRGAYYWLFTEITKHFDRPSMWSTTALKIPAWYTESEAHLFDLLYAFDSLPNVLANPCREFPAED